MYSKTVTVLQQQQQQQQLYLHSLETDEKITVKKKNRVLSDRPPVITIRANQGRWPLHDKIIVEVRDLV